MKFDRIVCTLLIVNKIMSENEILNIDIPLFKRLNLYKFVLRKVAVWSKNLYNRKVRKVITQPLSQWILQQKSVKYYIVSSLIGIRYFEAILCQNFVMLEEFPSDIND